MFTHRALALTSIAAVLAGCQITTAPQAPAFNGALTPDKARPYRIVSVDVSLADDFKGNTDSNGISDTWILTR